MLFTSSVVHILTSFNLHKLQPENVVCTTKGSKDVKLIDFGLAQRLEPGVTAKVLFETGEYCAPEVMTFEPVSFAADMWSLGVFAFVM